MAWTYTFDTATPAAGDPTTEGDDRIREVKLAIHERMDVDHFLDLTGTSQTDTDGGKHRQITFYSVIETPSPDAGQLILYIKGDTEQLYCANDTDWSGELQLTDADGILVVVDDDTIERSSGTIQLKDGTGSTGITAAKLATDAKEFCDDDTIEIDDTNGLQIKTPETPAAADGIEGAPVFDYGHYEGNGTTGQSIDTGITIKHLVIKRATDLSHGAVEAIVADTTWVWNQESGADWSDHVTISGTSFTLTNTGNLYVNASTVDYKWFAIGSRA